MTVYQFLVLWNRHGTVNEITVICAQRSSTIICGRLFINVHTSTFQNTCLFLWTWRSWPLMTLKTECNEMNFEAWKCESSNQIDSNRFGFRSKPDIFHVWGGHNEPCSPRFNICPIYVRHYYGLIIIWWCYNHIWFPINPIWSEKQGLFRKRTRRVRNR